MLCTPKRAPSRKEGHSSCSLQSTNTRRSQPINDAAKLQLLQPLSATSGDCGSLLGRDVATVKEAREGEGDFNAEYRRL